MEIPNNTFGHLLIALLVLAVPVGGAIAMVVGLMYVPKFTIAALLLLLWLMLFHIVKQEREDG